MKTDSSKVQKKVAKKAAKKELEQSLAQKFFEVIGNLGHDAEKIADEVTKAAKSVAGKLARKFAGDKKETERKVKAVKKKGVKKATVKVAAVKGTKKAGREVEKAVSRTKPLANSIKVEAIASEEKAADLIQPKKEVVAKTAASGRKSVAITSTPVVPDVEHAEEVKEVPVVVKAAPKRKPTIAAKKVAPAVAKAVPVTPATPKTRSARKPVVKKTTDTSGNTE